MPTEDDRLPTPSTAAEVDAFLRRLAATPAPGASRGRLIFALDATASREPTWDSACQIQAQMFAETVALGGLDVQLCWYRGFREFSASRWVSRPDRLLDEMTGVACLAGLTQVERVLRHAADEAGRRKVDALVFVGDCMEEDVGDLCEQAGRLSLLAVPAFLFHEGHDSVAEHAFREVARLTRGAYCRFDAGSARELRDLLSAVAVYASGGRRALLDFGRRRGGAALALTRQMTGGGRA